MVNPYFCYAGSFLIALLTYSLGWSDLYPPLSFSLLFFLAFTIVVCIVLGLLTAKTKIIYFRKLEAPRQRYPVLITIFIYVLWSVEFIYAGGVPLLKILLKEPYNYITFGVPSLHVFAVTFSSFYTIYLFHLYLSKKNSLILILYCINLVAALLIYNRAMVFFNLSATVFLYFIYKNKFSVKHMFVGSFLIVVLLFFFGALGSLRVSRLANKNYSNDGFLKTGAATESFRTSALPHEFFWSYIYISSPLANLQNNINTYNTRTLTFSTVFEWFNNEILLDFISKRINTYNHTQRESENTLPGPFNASTIYSRSFSYLGWAGLVLMSLIIMSVPVLLMKVLPTDSPFFLIALVILNTIFLFMVFDNTIRFTGLSFQLLYPVGFHFILKKWPAMKFFFKVSPTCSSQKD